MLLQPSTAITFGRENCNTVPMLLPRKCFKYGTSFSQLVVKTLQTWLQQVLPTNFVNGSSLMLFISTSQPLQKKLLEILFMQKNKHIMFQSSARCNMLRVLKIINRMLGREAEGYKDIWWLQCSCCSWISYKTQMTLLLGEYMSLL